MTSPHILIVKTGTTDPGVVRDHGDYDGWFARELRTGGARHTVVDAHTGAALPDPSRYDGIILTGSPLSVRDEAPWMSALGRWTLNAADTVPVLAVCFGLQLVGEALGGHIAPNPKGGEYGTIQVALTEAGRVHPLFAGLGDVLQVQSTHRDVLVRPPLASNTALLATTPNTQWQAFAWGPLLHAVQFHPELRADALADLMTSRGIEGETRPTEHGHRILMNWLAFVRQHPAPPPGSPAAVESGARSR